jgi:Uncharacterized protein conserved in bacteria
MIRLIKRYGSRKLYDTEESRYVSLEELAGWIRHGQEIRVVDNKTGDDVTTQTLTQIISEEGRRGQAFLPNELLHELIRLGEQAVSTGVEQVSSGVDKLMRASIDRLGPVRRAREEMARLQQRLADLEQSLAELELPEAETEPAPKPAAKPAMKAAKPAAKSAGKTAPKTTSKPAAGKKSASRASARKKAAPRSTAGSKAKGTSSKTEA